VDRALLTPVGLRTLDPADPDYRPHYGGDSSSRDSAYHQGTVWPWLLGPYADALIRADGWTPETRRRLVELIRPLLKRLREDGCLGTVNEIYDPTEPYAPVGCVAQAWSVSELLRIYAMLARPEEAPGVEGLSRETKVAAVGSAPRGGSST
jgi:glycogen debranching enzyme